MALLNTAASQWMTGIRTRVPRVWLLIFILAGITLSPVSAQPVPSREYQIKAVFLYNFLQFVDWPPSAFADDTAPLRIGILGDDPFGAALDEAVQGESIHNRKLVVVRSHREEDLKDCQLLFICKSEQRNMAKILARLGDRPVLTVSETPDFAQQGGIIAFYTDGKKVRFEINPAMARLAGLKLSSQLLGLGRIVGTETVQGGS